MTGQPLSIRRAALSAAASLGPAGERVRALAGFRLGKALDESNALLSGKPGDCRVLRLKA